VDEVAADCVSLTVLVTDDELVGFGELDAAACLLLAFLPEIVLSERPILA